MCIWCGRKPLSRRHFLRLGLAASLTAAAAACRPAAVALPGAFDRQPRPYSIPSRFPDLAGPVAASDDLGVTLAGPVGSRRVDWRGDTLFLNRQGLPAKPFHPIAGETILVWLHPLETESAVALQPLGAISAVDAPTPPLSSTTTPTGSVRTFGHLEVITRQGWGASERRWSSRGESGLYDPQGNPNGWLVYEEALADVLHTLIVHHSALAFEDGPQAVQALHMQTARFADVGYHFLIDGLGQLYEGRPLNVRGAHVGGFNTGTLGVCLLGNFELAPAIQGQLDTLTLLAETLKQEFGIGRLGGHRDFQPGVTACPGQNLHPLLDPLAKAVGLIRVRP